MRKEESRVKKEVKEVKEKTEKMKRRKEEKEEGVEEKEGNNVICMKSTSQIQFLDYAVATTDDASCFDTSWFGINTSAADFP